MSPGISSNAEDFEIGFILGLLNLRQGEKCKIEIFALWNWTWEMNHETVRVDMRGIEGRGLYLGKVSSEEVD